MISAVLNLQTFSVRLPAQRACVLALFIFALCMAFVPTRHAAAAEPLVIGLDADMSSGSAEAGQAILRGMEVAVAEINAQGGVLGRPLTIAIRDHRGNPSRGKDNMAEFANMPNLVAVMGGKHTPVAMAELDLIHQHKLVYLGPWAAGTPVVDNGFEPNFVFRVSVNDALAAPYLLSRTLDQGYKKPGLLLERTGWGRSNEKAFNAAASKTNVNIAATQWFNWGVADLSPHVKNLRDSGADVIILVANAREGVLAFKGAIEDGKAAGKKPLPIISHWGITGGTFQHDTAHLHDKGEILFLQTYSFLSPSHPDRAEKFLKLFFERYPAIKTVEKITSPAGTAHAYDLVHMLAIAIHNAQSIDRGKIQAALERIESYAGLVRDYTPPFSKDRHDALDTSDFSLAQFTDQGAIKPRAK